MFFAHDYNDFPETADLHNNVSKAKTMSISYADNGNILNKSDVRPIYV